VKWLASVILAICFLTGGVAYADSPSVDDVKVFQSYMETDDWLVVVTYNISGTNLSTSVCDTTHIWYLQFKDGVTADEISNFRIKQCGMRVGSIYMNADKVSALVWEGDYDVVLYGNWGTHPTDSYTLIAVDWRGEVENGGLDEWVLEQAGILQTFDSADYLDAVPGYDLDVLTVAGALIFNRGIAELESYRPDIFAVTTESLDIPYLINTDDTSYADDLYNSTEAAIGSTIYDAADDVGERWLGIDGRMMVALLTIMGFLSIAVIEKSIAFLIILGGVLVGFFPMGTVFLIVFIMMVVLVRSLFWSST